MIIPLKWLCAPFRAADNLQVSKHTPGLDSVDKANDGSINWAGLVMIHPALESLLLADKNMCLGKRRGVFPGRGEVPVRDSQTSRSLFVSNEGRLSSFRNLTYSLSR
jgi:hypothetical protein